MFSFGPSMRRDGEVTRAYTIHQSALGYSVRSPDCFTVADCFKSSADARAWILQHRPTAASEQALLDDVREFGT
jgi:hypothetical protein